MRRRRLEQLERRREERRPRRHAPEPADGEEAKARWLARAKARRVETRSTEEFHVRDVTNLLRNRGEFDGMDLKGFRARLREWRPPLDGRAIARVTARMAYDRQHPAEGMECPPEWREAFEAAEDLLDRYVTANSEDLARLIVAAKVLGGGDAEEERLDAEQDRLGITEELVDAAVGPDAEEVSEGERWRRIREVLSDFYDDEPGYEVQRRITRLVELGKADVGEEEWSRLTNRLGRLLAPPDDSSPEADLRDHLVREAIDGLAVGDLIVLRELEDAYAALPGRSPAEVWHGLTEAQRNGEHEWRRVCHEAWREVLGADVTEAEDRRLRKAVLGPVCNYPFYRGKQRDYHPHERNNPTKGDAS